MRTTGLLALLFALMLQGQDNGGSQGSSQQLVIPRLLEIAVDRISPARTDLLMRVSVRTTQDLTVRAVAFHESSLEGIPVSVEPIEADWKISAGKEFFVPADLKVRVYSRDLTSIGNLVEILKRQKVRIRATLEVDIATPWYGRLLFMGPTETAIVQSEVEVPLRTGPAFVQPVLQLMAGGIELVRAELGPVAQNAVDRLPERRALLQQYSSFVQPVDTEYVLEDEAGASIRRAHRALGFWWTPRTFCTTREALEPWRFDVSEAALLQIARGTLRQETLQLTIGIAASGATRLQLNGPDVIRSLPQLKERQVFTAVDGKPRKVRVLDREERSNLVCLGFLEETGETGPIGLRTGSNTAGPFAAFSMTGNSIGLVWTEIQATNDNSSLLAGPSVRASFGSPMASRSGVIGIVVSTSHALPVRAIQEAATRAIPAQVRKSGG